MFVFNPFIKMYSLVANFITDMIIGNENLVNENYLYFTKNQDNITWNMDSMYYYDMDEEYYGILSLNNYYTGYNGYDN